MENSASGSDLSDFIRIVSAVTIFWVWFGPILADQVISLAKKCHIILKP